MKILILNDTHAGARNSSEIFLDNAALFYNDILFPHMLKNDIKHIVHLGDVFDNRKFINFKALNHFRHSFLAKLREYKITMDVIRGNHDCFFKNTGELNSLKELLGHYMNEVTIIHDPRIMEYGSLKIGLVPWIDADNEKESLDFLANAKCDWIGGHFDIQGYEMMQGIKCEHGLDRSLFKRFEKVLSGHFHTKSEQDNIEYLGSQMEFFWNDAHDPKYFHVIDTETRKIEAIRNPHTLHHRIYYDDSKQDYLHYNLDAVENHFVKVVVINKSDSFTFDRFIDRIQNRNILELKIAENFNEFLGDAVNDHGVSVDDTPTLLNSYIDNVDTDLDKDRIKVEMSNLMTEAQSMEIA